MRSRLLLALPVLILGLLGLGFAVVASPGSNADNNALVRALNHPPKAADQQTTKFLSASRKVERRGYIRREAGRITAKGWVAVIAPSHGKDGTESGDYRYQLRARGKSIDLHVDPKTQGGLVNVSDQDDAMAFQPGQVVKVSGRPHAGGIAVERARLAGPALVSPTLGPVQSPRGTTPRKVAVLRFYKPGLQAQLPDEATLNNTLVGSATSVQEFFLRESNNSLALTFEVFPMMVELPATATCDTNQNWEAVTAAQALAEVQIQALGDSLENYDFVANIFELTDSTGNACSWNGNGERGFRNSNYRGMGTGGPGFKEFAHELGHNLSLGHSNLALATNHGVPVAIARDFVDRDSSDNGALMGGGWNKEGLTGPEQAHLGFLPLNYTDDVVPQLPENATPTTLAALDQELSGTTPRLLRIRRPSIKDPRSPDAYLYLDLRQKDPRDGFNQYRDTSPIVKGVGVRFGPTWGTGPVNGFNSAFRLLDSSPGRRATGATGDKVGNARNHNDAASDATKRTTYGQDFFLAVGQSMYDPVEKVTITTETLGGGQATVRIIDGPPPGNPTNVSVAGSELVVQAGAGRRNNVVLSEFEGRLIVVDVGNRVTVGAGCTEVDAQTASCSMTPIKSARVTLDVPTDSKSSDVGAVYGGLKLPVRWDGGNGQDSLEGGPGDDTFVGGPGGASGDDADLITGGGGNDRVDYSARSIGDPVTVYHDNAPYTDGGASEGDQIADDISGFVGGAGDDKVKLNPSVAQTIVGGTGKDTIIAGTTPDTIVSRDGTSGDQVFCGGGSTDQVFFDAGDTRDASCPSPLPSPKIEFTSGPENGSVTNATNVSFGFTAEYGGSITFTCKLENGTVPTGATAGSCTSAPGLDGTYTTSTSPSVGDKVFTVVGTIGGLVVTQASRTFRVDRTAPSMSIASAPPASPATTDATGSKFTFTSTDDSGSTKQTYECSLDNAVTWTSCGPTVSYPDIAPGSYRLIVRALDEGGNVSATRQHDWIVTYDTILDSDDDYDRDGQFPGPGFPNGGVGSPSGWNPGFWQFTAERPAFSFHATGTGASFWCKVDSGAWTPCSSATGPWRPATPLDLSVPHTIQIAAGTATERTDMTPLTFTSAGTSYALNINTRFTSGPTENGWVTETPVTFGFEAYWKEFWHGRDVNIPVDVTKFECRVDSWGWEPCDDGTYTSYFLSEGQHTLSVRAVRQGGEQRLDEDWTPAVRTFVVDRIAPPVNVSGWPSSGGWVAGPDASFPFSSDATVASYDCRLDGGSWETCSSPKSYTGLSTATHEFEVRAKDAAGNASSKTISFDVGVPHATITEGPAAGSYTNNPTPTFKFTAGHSSATFECAIGAVGSAPYSPCSSPWTVPVQSAGSRVFSVRAKLPSGQLDSSFSGRLVTFDYTAPVATQIDSGPAPASTVTTDDTQFAFSAPGETSPRFECKLDAAGWAPCTSPKLLTGLPNGTRTWKVHTIDRAGNVGPDQTRTFTVSKAKVLTVGSPAPATPSAVSLTNESGSTPALDWIQWNGTSPTAFTRKSGTPLISTWAARMSNQPQWTFTGPTTFSWTNAAGATPSGNSAVGASTGVANGRGFRFTVPATNNAVRTLKLYVGLRGASVTDAVSVKFNDGVTQSVNLTSNSDTAIARVYTVTYRPTAATDTLTVEWFQGGGTTKSTALAILYGAAVY